MRRLERTRERIASTKRPSMVADCVTVWLPPAVILAPSLKTILYESVISANKVKLISVLTLPKVAVIISGLLLVLVLEVKSILAIPLTSVVAMPPPEKLPSPSSKVNVMSSPLIGLLYASSNSTWSVRIVPTVISPVPANTFI